MAEDWILLKEFAWSRVLRRHGSREFRYELSRTVRCSDPVKEWLGSGEEAQQSYIAAIWTAKHIGRHCPILQALIASNDVDPKSRLGLANALARDLSSKAARTACIGIVRQARESSDGCFMWILTPILAKLVETNREDVLVFLCQEVDLYLNDPRLEAPTNEFRLQLIRANKLPLMESPVTHMLMVKVTAAVARLDPKYRALLDGFARHPHPKLAELARNTRENLNRPLSQPTPPEIVDPPWALVIASMSCAELRTDWSGQSSELRRASLMRLVVDQVRSDALTQALSEEIQRLLERPEVYCEQEPGLEMVSALFAYNVATGEAGKILEGFTKHPHSVVQAAAKHLVANPQGPYWKCLTGPAARGNEEVFFVPPRPQSL